MRSSEQAPPIADLWSVKQREPKLMNVDTESRNNKAHVFFAVSGFGDEPDAINALLGFSPTSAWCEGDPLPNHPTARRRHSRWSLYSPLPLQATVEEHLEALLALLESHAEEIRECAAQYPACLCCAIYYEDYNPGILLSQLVLQRCAALGVSVDFDLYFLGGPDPK